MGHDAENRADVIRSPLLLKCDQVNQETAGMDIYPCRVMLLDDGVYRWSYDMDM